MQRVFKALRLLTLAALTLLLVSFHGFVGYHKAFSTQEELVRHSAWTMHLPMWLGKTVGWVEMVATAVLLAALFLPKLARAALAVCLWFAALEVVAGIVHQVTQDGGSVTQNLLAILLTLALAWLYGTRQRSAAD